MNNTRPVKNREIILLYRFRDTGIGRQLYGVAARMGIMCKVVEENQTEETLGSLLKLPGFEPAGCMGDAAEKEPAPESEQPGPEDNQELQRQVMIMHGFTNRRLEELLQNMRRAGMPSIPLKAIVTPQNVNWTFRALYRELEREHEEMQKLRQQKKI